MSRGAEPPDAAALLDVLRKVDGLYAPALTLTGAERTGGELLRPGDPGGTFEWRLTRNADETVLHRVRVEGPPPFFVPKGESNYADYDEDGNQIASVLVEEVHHFSPEERFRLQRYRKPVIAPDGTILSDRTMESVAFFRATDDEPSLPVKRALWSTGRGFAAHLDEILKVDARDDGLLSVVARGFESPASRGTWNLVVDPARSYLVTEAAYTRDGRDDPTIRLTNAGARGEPPCEVAATGDWTVNVGWVSERGVECADAGFRVDEELLAFGRRTKAGPFAPGALAFDKRSGVHVAMDLDPKEVPAPPAPTRSYPRASTFVMLLNAHFVVGLLAYWGYRRYRRRACLGGSP